MSKGTENLGAYFASANSYRGFKSYFDRIFNSKDFTKIYVLKGGPGTGKSTIMKRACGVAEESGYLCEKFYCSSDPASLDGVILSTEGGRVAIIDGTAPHERDAVIPGAVDELVPLGIAFDISGLEGHRESIENLNAKKNEAYLNAYRDLSFSSEFDEKIKAEILKTFDFNAARESAYQLYRDISSCFSDNDRADLRLISSFSKEGYSSLSLSNSLAERTYGISGKFGSELIFMKLLYELLVQKNVKFRYFPSPLLPDEIEAIAFTDSRTVIRITNENAYIDTEIFLKSDMIGTRTEALALLSGGRDHFLNEAQNYLSLASEYHFKLEEIYTRHMTFDIVNRMTDELLEKVKNILSR